jgi:hypothetical protein
MAIAGEAARRVILLDDVVAQQIGQSLRVSP